MIGASSIELDKPRRSWGVKPCPRLLPGAVRTSFFRNGAKVCALKRTPGSAGRVKEDIGLFPECFRRRGAFDEVATARCLRAWLGAAASARAGPCP